MARVCRVSWLGYESHYFRLSEITNPNSCYVPRYPTASGALLAVYLSFGRVLERESAGLLEVKVVRVP
jgi:hypothetical protein